MVKEIGTTTTTTIIITTTITITKIVDTEEARCVTTETTLAKKVKISYDSVSFPGLK